MIVAVAYQYHDYQLSLRYVDTDKLNEENPVDKVLLKELKKKNPGSCQYVARDEEEPDLTHAAWVKKTPSSEIPQISKAVILEILFDC